MLNARLLLTVLLAAMLCFLPAAASAEDTITDLSQIKEIDFSGLSEAQKRIALKVMNEHGCNCGCQMSIAECRFKMDCRRSLIFARTVVDALREGKSEAEVVKTLKRKADTFVEVRPPDDTDVIYEIDVTQNPVRGPRTAPVTIVEFSDFQCPFCAELEDTLKRILAAFPNDVQLIYKQYPLNIHRYAHMAAMASLAAHGQGKFWEMHDRLFENFTAIDDANIRQWAREIGLNMNDFERALMTSQHDALVRKDMADGAAANVMGTPTLFINGRRIHDRSFENLKEVILEELAAIRSGSKPTAKSATASTR
jgi:protein-disulfide isomerase